MGMTFYSENHCGEQSSLQRGALFPDQVRRKPIVFEALRSGTIDGEAWKYVLSLSLLNERLRVLTRASLWSSRFFLP
jgi:hypothetical protein